MKLINKNKYYSTILNCWETEYTILYVFKIYKRSKFLAKDKYSLFKSKTIVSKPIIYKPILSKEEALKEFGTNKYTYPLEPYLFTN